MYKKFLWVFILVGLILIPKVVLADSIIIEDTNIYNETYEYYKVSGGVLSYDDANSNNYNIKLDKTNKKLYLNNFITTKKIETDIDGLNIILEGQNEIISDDNAIYTNNNIIFSGNGSIFIEGNSNGIKSEKKVTINSGTYNINGITYNGIEALAIEINDGVVKTKGGYSGIHTMSHDPLNENEYFHINGGNLFTTANIGDAINSTNTNYDNSIVVIEDSSGTSLDMYGNSTLLADATITKELKIERNSILTIGKDVTLKLLNKDLLKLEGTIIIKGNMLAKNSRYYNLYIKEYDGGVVKAPYNIVLEGEEVNLEVIASEGYKLNTLQTVNDILDIKANIIDNKFIMPSADITIEATFVKDSMKEIINPKTGDNIISIFIVLGISLIGIVSIVFYLIKKKV